MAKIGLAIASAAVAAMGLAAGLVAAIADRARPLRRGQRLDPSVEPGDRGRAPARPGIGVAGRFGLGRQRRRALSRLVSQQGDVGAARGLDADPRSARCRWQRARPAGRARCRQPLGDGDRHRRGGVPFLQYRQAAGRFWLAQSVLCRPVWRAGGIVALWPIGGGRRPRAPRQWRTLRRRAGSPDFSRASRDRGGGRTPPFPRRLPQPGDADPGDRRAGNRRIVGPGIVVEAGSPSPLVGRCGC